jgi:hypothetical protein
MAAQENAQQIIQLTDGAKKIAKFYGDPTKDTVTVEQFIEQVKNVSNTNNWSQKTTCENAYLALGGPAKLRIQIMRNDFEYVEQFDKYEEALLKHYSPKQQPGDLVLQFPSLRMKKGESVNDYELRIRHLVGKMVGAYEPAPFRNFDEAMWATFSPAQREAIRARDATNQLVVKKQKVEEMVFQLFMGYVETPFREELRRNKPKTAEEAMSLALQYEQECKGQELKYVLPQCSTREEIEHSTPEAPKADTNAIQTAMDNAISAVLNRIGYQGKPSGNNSYQHRPSKTCFFCNKKGHTQEDCYKRQRMKAPCKDKDGKEYYPGANGTRKYTNKTATVIPIQATSEQGFH